MFEYKLQIGCLLVILYFIVSYLRESQSRKVPRNKYFGIILFFAPCAVIFDGITSWTVNHLEQVPLALNQFLHGCFFVSANVVIIYYFLYLVQQTIGIKNKRRRNLFLIPGGISLLGTVLFLNRLDYIKGDTTNYSMGISVVFCYASLLIHLVILFILVCIHRRTLERRKIVGVIVPMILMIGCLLTQIFYPECLISALLATFAVIGIYVGFENPSIRRIEVYNSEMVTAFATLVENRDNSTGGHIRRTRDYVRILLDEMKNKPEYRTVLTKDYIKNVIEAAPMHDIGKIAIPDYILQKPGRLTDEEYTIMKTHSAIGGKIIKETFSGLDDTEYEQIAYEVARFHHEKWNGKGYPDGLKEKQIPLHARIMAIADVFDAVSAKRCYRDAMPIEKCFRIMEEGRGTDFDPELTDLFLGAKSKVLEYYEKDEQKGL